MNLCSNSHEPSMTEQRDTPKCPKSYPSAELTTAHTFECTLGFTM